MVETKWNPTVAQGLTAKTVNDKEKLQEKNSQTLRSWNLSLQAPFSGRVGEWQLNIMIEIWTMVLNGMPTLAGPLHGYPLHAKCLCVLCACPSIIPCLQ